MLVNGISIERKVFLSILEESFKIVFTQSEPEVKEMFLFTIYKYFSYAYVHGDGEGT